MQMINFETYVKPTDFLSIPQGETRIRLISDGAIGFEHGSRIGMKYVPLGKCSQNTSCEHCLKGLVPTIKYKWVVWLSAKKQVFLLSASSSLGDEICMLGKKTDLRSNDILITRNGVGRQTKYRVAKAPQSEPIDKSMAEEIKTRRDYLFMRYIHDEN